jgi:hypothetical protein
MDNSELIEDYFSGSPDPEEVRRFEGRIESDPVFAEEVAFYLSVKGVTREITNAEKKEQFREFYLKNQATAYPDQEAGTAPISVKTTRLTPLRSSPLRRMMYYMSAAAVVAAISFVIYTYVQKESPRELASDYERNHLTTLPVMMSGRTDSVQTGLRLYNEGKLQEARFQFEQIILRDSSYYPAITYAGLACLLLKNYDTAIYYFKKLESRKDLYSNPAVFYQAVTLMERNQPGDSANAKKLLQEVVENGLEGKEAAQIMLNKW